MQTQPSINIAIFASGTGSNAAKIIEHFRVVADIRVALIVSNRADAGVLEIAHKADIPTLLINRTSFYQENGIMSELERYRIDYIILAGFLWLIPPYLVNHYADRMLNIHPALLPKYGGKGMYGMNVHRAVKAAGEHESGISIHLVNEAFDEGAIIFQRACPLNKEDTPEDIRRKVLVLEHHHFAQVCEDYIRRHQKTLTEVPAD